MEMIDAVFAWVETNWWAPVAVMATYFALCALAAQRLRGAKGAKSGGGFLSERTALVHNILLVGASLSIFVWTGVEAVRIARRDGWQQLVCFQPPAGQGIWGPANSMRTPMLLFHMTKYVELFDTAFIFSRGRIPDFLHVYHHGSMLVVTWSWFGFPWFEGSWWCGFVNSFIHVLMYYYYAVTLLGQRVWWKKYLTSSQIIQFGTGLLFVGTFYWLSYNGAPCAGNPWTGLFSTAVNVSFLLLFVAFYKRTYKKPQQKRE